MYKIIEQTVLSNITDTNDVAQTTTDPEMDPYDTHVHNYDNCKWGFVLMNRSFPDAVFDYTALCCFEEGNIINMDSDPNWNNSALIDCYERAYFSDVPKKEQPCYVVPSRWGYPLQENHQAYSQFEFLKWLPLIAFLLVLSFVMTTRRKTDRGGTLFNGFIGIPEVINMLDNERTRWVSAALFFSFGYQLFLMVVHPLDVDLPFYELKLGNVTFLEKKLIIIAYYLMVYAPLVMGLPRYDFYGSLISLLYTWMITIHNYTRDYACATDPWTWLFKLPEHIAWTLLSLLIPALMIRVATINIKSNKESIIGRFNERYIKYINGYENWKEENYYFHTVDLATSSKIRNTSKTVFERHCWSANNLFKYHSRLLSIVLTSMLAIYVEVLVLVLIYRPYVHHFTRETIEGWRSIAPYVIMFDQFLSSQGQDNLFDADKVGWYLQVFQTYVGVIPACFNIAIVTPILVTCFNLYRMLINYREHCKQVIRGDYSEVHVTKHTPTSLMTGNLKYQAYQTAYISIGFIIQLYLFFTVLLLLCWLFILPLSGIIIKEIYQNLKYVFIFSRLISLSFLNILITM